LERTVSAHRKLEEEMRDSNEKKDAVAHWEAQIAEIIQWYVLPTFGFQEWHKDKKITKKKKNIKKEWH